MRPQSRKRTIRHLAIIGLGWLFVVLGVLGLVLPVLQGILFLMIGVTLLSAVSPRVRLFRQRTGQRFPHLRKAAHEAGVFIKNMRRKYLGRG
ncbi:MAG: hypothetical protein ACE5EM_10180 [Sphingomonadales bacterium]